jgi:ABC transporter substrate binding protein (PQQ-dependent alcohol dehydrogenase system)
LEGRNDDNGDAAAAGALADCGVSLVIADLPAGDLLKAADAGKRAVSCSSTSPHRRSIARETVAPMSLIRADALDAGRRPGAVSRLEAVAQMVPGGRLHAETSSVPTRRRAAKRFGARIVQEKVFDDTGGARRTDSGVVQIQRQLPVFTQGAPAYDVLVAADESDVFAPYLPYRTWDPRPVAGSAGLVPTSWDASHDQWGAVQLQERFTKRFSRHMTARDMQAWSAARMIGESASRTRSTDAKVMFDFLKSPDFALAAFKGQRLTLRDWNLQLRQPILLTDGRMIVSVSPQEGFQHQFSELDTLGYDRPETKCRL